MQLYYNNVALPPIPEGVTQEYPYYWVRQNKDTGYYDLAFSTSPYYFKSSRMYTTNASQKHYRVAIDTVVDESTEWVFLKDYAFATSDYWGLTTNVTFLWSPHDIPSGSLGSTTLYFRGMEPVPHHYECEQTTATSLTKSIKAKAGEWLLATVSTRSETTFSEGWEVLSQSAMIATGNSQQQMFFLCKEALEDGEYALEVTQASSARIYINLLAVPDIKGFHHYEGSEFSTNVTTQSIAIDRPPFENIIWGCSAITWNATVPYGKWQCDTLHPMCYNDTKAQPRQANFMDTDITVDKRTFSPSVSDGSVMIIDFVEAMPYERRYLLKSEDSIYTVKDGELTKLEVDEVTSLVFQEHGVDSCPEFEVWKGLVDPEILFWKSIEDGNIKLKASMCATPPPQIIISNKADLTHPSITGIENMVATLEGDVTIAVSFDDKATWKAWNGTQWATLSEDFTGMNKETLESITFDQWNMLYTGANGFYIRITILDATQSFTEIVVDFSN